MQMHKEDLTIFKICNIVQSREIHFLLLLLTDKIDIMQTYPLQRKGWYIAREPFLWYFPTAPGALIVGTAVAGFHQKKVALENTVLCPLPWARGWSKWPFYGENTRTGLQRVNQVERELLRCQLWGLFLPLPDLLPQRLPFNFTQTTSDFWKCSAPFFCNTIQTGALLSEHLSMVARNVKIFLWSNGQLKRVEIADAYELKKVVQEWKKKTLNRSGVILGENMTRQGS